MGALKFSTFHKSLSCHVISTFCLTYDCNKFCSEQPKTFSTHTFLKKIMKILFSLEFGKTKNQCDIQSYIYQSGEVEL